MKTPIKTTLKKTQSSFESGPTNGDKVVRAAVIKGLRDWGVNFPDREMPELIDYIMKRLKGITHG